VTPTAIRTATVTAQAIVTRPAPTTANATTPQATARRSTTAATPNTGGASCAPGVELLGSSDALDKITFVDMVVGGLSALVYDATRDLYYSLVDNERDTPAHYYTRAPAARRRAARHARRCWR
jgi:hypothetical protein